MITNISYWLGLSLCLLSTMIMAQTSTEEWAKRYDSQGPTSEEPEHSKMIAIDAAGNSYITGTSYNYSTDGSRIVTIKYSPTGEELWVQEYIGNVSNRKEAVAIIIDNKGGVYITGTNYFNYVTIRYNIATGEETWVSHYDGPEHANDQAIDLTIDNQGGIYVTGTSDGDYATIRYDAVTGAQSWVSRYNGGDFDMPSAIAVDNRGGVFVTGTSYYHGYATIRYNAANGAQSWVSHYSGEGYYLDGATGIAVDKLGGIYVTGTSYNNDSSYDYATIRYEAATGTQSWVTRYKVGNNSYNQATAIAVDEAGGVYVTGYSGTDFFDSNYATIRYEATTGEETWAQRFGRPVGDRNTASAIAVDKQGGVYVTGTSVIDNNTYYFATIRYSTATGTQNWVSRYGETGKDQDAAKGIAVDNQGSVYVIGRKYVGGTGLDYITIRYNITTGEENWSQRYNAEGSQGDYGIAIAIDAEGNSYVTGTSQNVNIGSTYIITIKYSPSGEEMWINEDKDSSNSQARSIALDNHGGVYVTGNREGNYITIRYDAATGTQNWVHRYTGEGEDGSGATAIVVDNAGGVFVTGGSQNKEDEYDYATIRYDAITGIQSWVSLYNGEGGNNRASSITVDNKGGVYVTGTSNRGYATVRYDATTGSQTWAKSYKGGGNNFDRATAIVSDTEGGIYVTGTSRRQNNEDDYATIRYNAMTGEQEWVNLYDAGRKGDDIATAIAVDNQGGIFVTGRSSKSKHDIDIDPLYDYATVRYEAANGAQSWVSRYEGGRNSSNFATAVAVDINGGIYVTGFSELGPIGFFSTVKYTAATGAKVWEIQKVAGNYEDAARDLALDGEGNIIVTGYSTSAGTGADFLTIKYSQEQDHCIPPTRQSIRGGSPVTIDTPSIYSIPGTLATSFNWHISGSDGTTYSNFQGQSTNQITVRWPDQPDIYKMTVTYSTGTNCPAKTTSKYVHVFDSDGGFVTGGGWLESPANTKYELIQEAGKGYWAFAAKYTKGEEVQGSLLFTFGNYAFRSTNINNGSLVITDERAYFRGQGTISKYSSSGKLSTDPRRFGYLLTATDAQVLTGKEESKKSKNPDRLRLLIWFINEDGSKGKIVYDNQTGCSSTNNDYNAPACLAIGGGNVVIHRKGLKNESSSSIVVADTPQLLEVYPTLLSEQATVSFSVDSSTDYILNIYDIRGAFVRKVAEGKASAGQLYNFKLYAEGLSDGLYFVHLSSGSKIRSVKLLVQK